MSTTAEAVTLTPLMTVAEVCAYLRMSRSRLYEVTRSGELAYVKTGAGAQRFVRDDVEAFVRRRRVAR